MYLKINIYFKKSRCYEFFYSHYQVFGTKDIFGTIMLALYELRESSGRCFNMKFLKFVILEVRFYAVTPHLISLRWYIT